MKFDAVSRLVQTPPMNSQLLDLFRAAVNAADPLHCLPPHLDLDPSRPVWVFGAGKAAGRMAQVFEQQYAGAYQGLVVGPADQNPGLTGISYHAGTHPIPSQASCDAGNALLRELDRVQPQDQVIFLLSGGASSLIATPPDRVALSELQSITQAMLNGGANIAELNAVRRCISKVAGGRLAQACAAPITTLAISDVTGDVPADIGSGPTVTNPTSNAQVQGLLDRFQIQPSAALREFLADQSLQPRQVDGDFRLIATPEQSLSIAQQQAEQAGLNVLNLGAFIEGDANETAKVLAGITRQIHQYNRPVSRPALILSGGETSVRVTGQGRGGRNVQFLMSLAESLNGLSGVSAMACDTDGVDGADPIAGGAIDATSLSRADQLGYPVRRAIEDNDGHGWFAALGDSVVTGPTQTNVNDFRAILVQ